jgi:hypothetical protein
MTYGGSSGSFPLEKSRPLANVFDLMPVGSSGGLPLTAVPVLAYRYQLDPDFGLGLNQLFYSLIADNIAFTHTIWLCIRFNYTELRRAALEVLTFSDLDQVVLIERLAAVVAGQADQLVSRILDYPGIFHINSHRHPLSLTERSNLGRSQG